MNTCTTLIEIGEMPYVTRQCALPTTWRCEDCAVPVCRWHAVAKHFEHKVEKADGLQQRAYRT